MKVLNIRSFSATGRNPYWKNNSRKSLTALKFQKNLQRLKHNTIKSMKKLLLIAIAVGSFSLFSFRTVNEIKITRNAENPNLYDVEYSADTFTTSVETFPDKFIRARETWTKVDKTVITGLQASMAEIDEVLKNL